MPALKFCYWDRLDDLEDPEAYDCFTTYLYLGAGRRTLARVARDHAKPYGTIQRWADIGVWKERAEEFDKHLLAERQVLLAERAAADSATWADRRAELLSELEQVTTTGLAQLLHDIRTKRRALRPNELRLLIETQIKWQNLANGDATDRIDNTFDLSNMSDEELAQYDELTRKAETEKPQTH